jgi:hypothetical protein
MEPSLQEIGVRYATDKVVHGYLPHYELLFNCFRHEAFDLLEIGVQRGASIRMWHEYFPQARIVGLDIEPIELEDEAALPRYTFVQGSQSDEAVLRRLTRAHRFRVAIDDGSHVWSDQIFTFEQVFPELEDGGVYVCEDIHTSFLRRKETFRGDATTNSAAYFLGLAKAVVRGWAGAGERAREQVPGYTVLPMVQSVTFVQHGVILTKTVPGEGRRALRARFRQERASAEGAA